MAQLHAVDLGHGRGCAGRCRLGVDPAPSRGAVGKVKLHLMHLTAARSENPDKPGCLRAGRALHHRHLEEGRKKKEKATAEVFVMV